MRYDDKRLFPPTEEELQAARLASEVNKGARKMELTVQELAAELTVARKQIRELEEANMRLAREVVMVRRQNAQHLNEIQRIALEKDRYAKIVDLLNHPKEEIFDLAELLREQSENPLDRVRVGSGG